MRFIKMHALGNDYVYIDCIREQLEVPPDLIRRMSKFHTGIGSDGVILILPSDQAVARMRMFNPDGTEGEMCGNGLRCIAKYVYEAGYAPGEEFDLDTVPGIRHQWVKVRDGKVYEVTSTLGRPVFERARIPMTGEGDRGIGVKVNLPSGEVELNSLSLGNPHTVIFVDDLDRYPCEKIGPQIETHPLFPERTNVEFVQVLSPRRLRMRIWERGTGMTLASGSGSTASTVASVVTGRAERKVTVELPLGEIRVEYPEDGDLLMTGPVHRVFEGVWNPD